MSNTGASFLMAIVAALGAAESARAVPPNPVRMTPLPSQAQAAPDEDQLPAQPPRRTIFYQSQTIIVTVRPPPLSDSEADMLSRGSQKCVRADRIAEATMLDDRAVELKLRSGDALRLTLADNCPVLGFYGGFYVSRQSDRLCAGRDFLLARSGQRCAIAEIQRTRVRH